MDMARPTNPFNEISHLFERMQSDFEEMARTWSEEPEVVSSSVRVDLEDKDDEFVLTAELPGFDKEDIDVRLTDRTLQVSAEREEEEEEAESGEYIRRERHRKSISRKIPLPEAVDTDGVSATHNNGVLTVQMPKTEPTAEGTEIDVD